MSADEVFWLDVWAKAVRAAYKIAYGERLAQLRGKRTKSFDDRGLHPPSEQWGRITLAESFIQEGAGLPYVSPASVRSMAETDAYHDFIAGLKPPTEEE